MNILELIHESGFIYNDLKPDNILIGFGQDILLETSKNSPENIFKNVTLNLIDFGLASEWINKVTGRHS